MPLKPQEQALLAELAETYTAYSLSPGGVKNENWAVNRRPIGLTGAFLIDRCADDPQMMQSVLDTIRNGLTQDIENPKDFANAQKVCQMFQELYHHDPAIKGNISRGLHEIDAFSAGKLVNNPNMLESVLRSSKIAQHAAPPYKPR